jgi:hypothetical protein
MPEQPPRSPVLGICDGWTHSWPLEQVKSETTGVLWVPEAKTLPGLPRVPAPIRVMPATPTADPARRAANAPVARLGVPGSPGRRTSLLIGARIWGTSNSRGMTYGANASIAPKPSLAEALRRLMHVHQQELQPSDDSKKTGATRGALARSRVRSRLAAVLASSAASAHVETSTRT